MENADKMARRATTKIRGKLARVWCDPLAQIARGGNAHLDAVKGRVAWRTPPRELAAERARNPRCVKCRNIMRDV